MRKVAGWVEMMTIELIEVLRFLFSLLVMIGLFRGLIVADRRKWSWISLVLSTLIKFLTGWGVYVLIERFLP